jgi:hypothetical protein
VYKYRYVIIHLYMYVYMYVYIRLPLSEGGDDDHEVLALVLGSDGHLEGCLDRGTYGVYEKCMCYML